MFPEGRILDFLIVGVVALIVVGPKDLPLLMRKVGQFVARMRAMAAEFRASFDDMARQSELDELRRDVEAMRAGQPLHAAAGLGKDGEVTQVFDDIHASLRSGDAQLHPPMSYQSEAAEPADSAEDVTGDLFDAPHLPLSSPSGESTGEAGDEGLPPAKAAS